MTDPAADARAALLDSYETLICDVGDCADAVAAAWEGPPTDRREVVEPLTALLRRRGILAQLPEVLASAVDAAGYDLRADPVPAPPYVVITSTGPVLRATVADGRLVVRVECFELVPDDGGGKPRYGRRDVAPEDALSVTFVQSR
ncbi:hypothetical protein [Haloarchaeobius sp. DT45]|uniref:hypothetical protein n=1 Tax=Haloarchaeobius sp. DT45 TaxID=3446116 RepID=UPI003F6C6786